MRILMEFNPNFCSIAAKLLTLGTCCMIKILLDLSMAFEDVGSHVENLFQRMQMSVN